jgi:hypothetical protein
MNGWGLLTYMCPVLKEYRAIGHPKRLGGQKPSRENDRADKSPSVIMRGRTKALLQQRHMFIEYFVFFSFQCTKHTIIDFVIVNCFSIDITVFV